MAPQASRRFHEAGVGSRTGLRLSAVARDEDGFEDLEAFYKASEAALDHRPPPENDEDEDDEVDYDSFEETEFSKRPTSAKPRRPAASSSSTMDIQNSSAPSPRSILRSARQSEASKGQTANMTLADDDDDLDLPDLSTGSRSFDLGAADTFRSASGAKSSPNVPAKGFLERQTPRSPAKTKGVAKAARIELSDSEDDRLLAEYHDDDDNAGTVDDYEVTPVRPSPARPKHKSPTRAAVPPAAKKRAMAEEKRAASSSRAGPASPKRKAASPRKKKAVEPEPTHELAYAEPYEEPEYDLPVDSHSPLLEPAQPPKRKRGRPPKDPEAPKPLSKARANGVSRPAVPKSKASKAASNAADGRIVEKVRSQTRVATVYDENGVRRSTRQRFAPLEYWRGEHVRYGRPSLPSGTTIDDLRRSQRPGEDDFEDDPSMMLVRKRVPVLDVKEVIRVPRAPGEGTFAGTTRVKARRKRTTKSEDRKSRTPDAEAPEEDWWQIDPTEDTVHAEEGWDAKTVETGMVIDDDEGMEVEMSIVRTKASLNPVAGMNQEFRFEKLFNCGGLMATGVLQLPPGARKPTKPSKDNSFVFCVLQGALRATVHRKSFIVAPEGVFQVPAGNTYSLENVCERDVHLFFAQCRKTKKPNAGDLTTFTQMSDTSYGTPALPSASEVIADARRPFRERDRMMAADSDQQDSDEEDDFETSRQLKTKKRIFRKV